MLSFGTYRLESNVAEEMVRTAYNLNMRHFDTAQLYKNDIQVTNLLESLEAMHEDDYIDLYTTRMNISMVSLTTKIHRNLIKNSDRDNRAIVNSIYGRPNIVLLHSPEKNYEIAWHQLCNIMTDHLMLLGVSNFAPEHIERLKIKPYVNQIELTPFCQARQTVEYCNRLKIKIQGHSCLAKGEMFSEQTLCSIAKKYNSSPAQVMLAWGLNKKYDMCFTTKNKTHLVQNLASCELASMISVDDYKILDGLDCGYRTHPQFKLY